MRTHGYLVAFLSVGLFACGHETNVERTTSTGAKPENAEPAGKQGKVARSKDKLSVASAPAGLLAPDALSRIRQALKSKGFHPGESGSTLDEKTKAALREFQEREKLPATGIPDHETVSHLGLAPKDIFQKVESEKKENTQAANEEERH